jgi:hypothetical protein
MWKSNRRTVREHRPTNRHLMFEPLEDRRLLAIMYGTDEAHRAYAQLPQFESAGFVGLLDAEGNLTHGGSAVLIGSQWIVLSGHQVVEQTYASLVFGHGPNIFTDPGQMSAIASTFVFPGYSGGWGGSNDDIALAYLSTPITGVTPAQRSYDEAYIGMHVSIVGFGTPGTTAGMLDDDYHERGGENIVNRIGWGALGVGTNYLLADFGPLRGSTPLPLEFGGTAGDSGGGWFNDMGELVAISAFEWGGSAWTGGLRVSLYNDWIDSVIATHSPAPLGVTVAIADSQPAVVNHNPVHFTVTFSSPVLDFETGDAIVSGVPGDLVTTITPVGTDGTVYNVAVAGITGTGYVTLTVPAGSVTNAAGRTNTASVSLDAGVFYDLTLPEVSAQGLVTNNPAPTLVGTVADNHEVGSVTVVVAGQSVLAAINPDGTWSAVLASPIADGTHNVLVTARDVAGNSATATSVLVVDTVAPVATVNTLVTQTTTPTITGTAGDLTPTSGITSVLVGVAGNSYPALLDANTWSMTLPSALADGRYDVQVQVTDAAGNSSSVTSPGALIVDTRAPVMGGLAASVDAVLRGGQITLTASGVSDPGGQVARVEFYRADVLLGCDEDGTDGWSLTVAVLDWPLGEHALSAIAVDWCEARSDSVGVWVVVGREHPAVELGAVALFADRVRHVALHNDGAEVLTVRSVGPEAAFTISPVGGSAGGEAWTIAPGTSTMFAVSFAAATVGRHAAVVAMIGESDARLVPLGATVLGGWHNGGDVNGDGLVTPLDVLILINEINRDGARTLVPRTIADPGLPLFLDSNADGDLTAADVLAVINMLNWQFRPTSEGESPRPAALEAKDVDSALIELLALMDEPGRNAGRHQPC